jgi:hypothetical protein
MEISKHFLVVTMSFLFLSLVVADLNVNHNIKKSIPPIPPIPLRNLKVTTKTFDSPPLQLPHTNLNFGMLPKGPVPPSEPSKSPKKPPPFRH